MQHAAKVRFPPLVSKPNFRFGLPPTCARDHRSDGPKANHALTFNLDHSSGAAQQRIKIVLDVAKAKGYRSGENPVTAIEEARVLPKVAIAQSHPMLRRGPSKETYVHHFGSSGDPSFLRSTNMFRDEKIPSRTRV
jgi:hypothetical protein